ncbi:hypothetical protein [Janibacter anophelis]|uniref:hypothetical protein n=1 Tax=Janibacter anophelis TaxID=319054 RepID=UPI000DEFF839|nr:hypothetical protein [Janibacter anophelis]
MAIFSPSQLRTWLRYDEDEVFDEATATLVEQVVTGWLVAEIGALPEPTPQQGHPLFGWALELGGIAYENPTSMTSDTAGETNSSWADRRLQVLAAARRWAEANGTTGTTRPLPRGSFPTARPWPENLGCR